MRKGLSYDDVLIEPKRSPIDSRSDVDISSEVLSGVELDIPIISSPMDTVTDGVMAREMDQNGGLGILHRFNEVGEQQATMQNLHGTGVRAGFAIGVDEGVTGTGFRERVAACADYSNIVCIDVAHAHLEKSLDAVEEIRAEYPDHKIIAGTVATSQGVKDLARAGADAIRVGVGTGSHCTTRIEAGVGIPQLTAIRDAIHARKQFNSRYGSRDVKIWADGGIKNPGDAAKALLLGADAVVMGGELGKCEESAAEIIEDGIGNKYKLTHGMASDAAQDGETPVEGVQKAQELSGPLSDTMQRYRQGIQSACSYCGSEDLSEARQSVKFIEASPSTQKRNGSF